MSADSFRRERRYSHHSTNMESQATIHTHIHTRGQIKLVASPVAQIRVFGLGGSKSTWRESLATVLTSVPRVEHLPPKCSV